MGPRQGAVAAFVRGRDEAVTRGQGGGLPPEGRELDPVDAASPRVPWNEAGLELALGELALRERPACERAEVLELWLGGC
jgi:hypothetical protein